MTDNAGGLEKTMDAGEFSQWLESFFLTMKGQAEGVVPCKDCVSCCTSSRFVHVRPTDLEALACIPPALLFPAPGLPNGHFLLGYDERGCCPMFKKGACSIYFQRPETCRQFDCRVFSVPGLDGLDMTADIVRRAEPWSFGFTSKESVQLLKAIQNAYAFLSQNQSTFPDSFPVPQGSGRILLALRIHSEFVGKTDEFIDERRDHIIQQLVQRYGHRQVQQYSSAGKRARNSVELAGND